MRPALQRLLKRPTSLALLDAVVYSRFELSHSRLIDRCPRCYAHGLKYARSESLGAYGAEEEEVAYKEWDGRESRKGREDEDILYSRDTNAHATSSRLRKKNDSIQTKTIRSRDRRVRSGAVSNFLARKPPEDTSGPHGRDLDFESDVGHSRDIGSKLIDKPQFAGDFDLWEELLLYRQRVYGDDGVIDIWRGLRDRGDGIDLPVEKRQARFFWETFIGVGLRREDFLDEIHSYARQLLQTSGKRWTRLYSTIVGGFLEIDAKKAIRWHELLKDDHLPIPNSVLGVFRQARTSKDGLWAFRKILMTVEGHQVYHSVVPMLCAQKRFQEALSMHRFLVSRHDWPQSVADIEPLIQYMEKCESKEEGDKFWKELVTLGIMQDQKDPEPEHSPCPDQSTPSHEPLLKEKRFSDEFGARLFATKAFTFDLLLGGLKMFGVEAIGPLTLREMAIRAGSAEEVEKQISSLRQAGLSIGNSVFARVVQKLASSRDERTLHDVLYSDQHPDVLEDADVQEILFSTYYQTQDWRQVKKTLIILGELNNEDPHAFNLHFRRAIRLRDRATCSRIIEEMREHGLAPSAKSARLMLERFLPPRRKGYRPRLYPGLFDELMFLIGSFQHIVQCGGEVPPEYWLECFRQLGMTDRWDQLQKLCLWFAHFYRRDRGTVTESQPEPWHGNAKNAGPSIGSSTRNQLLAAHPKSPLRVVFCVSMQRAIAAWGFQTPVTASTKPILNPFSEQDEPLIPWVRGIILLRQLKENGVIVQTNTARKVCRQRLAVLFGVHRVSSRRINRVLRRDNPYTLQQVLTDIDKAWGKPLFWNFKESRHKLVNPLWQRRSRGNIHPSHRKALQRISAAHADAVE